jgi:DNA polymerase
MQRRDAALELLGIERWQLRGASPAQPAVAVPAAAPRATEPEPATAPPIALVSALAPPGRDSWEALVAEVNACKACALHATRTRPVFGVGDRKAQWLVIGEAPGAEEDRQGEPFVGRAGGLLNAMLLAVGLRREQVYIANILKSRPPNNRDPSAQEVASCLPFLRRQIALLQPRIILVVGRIAAQNLLATDAPIGRLRGQLHHFGEQRIPLVVTYHPAYLLRSPAEKRKAWEDLKLARRVHAGLPARAVEG